MVDRLKRMAACAVVIAYATGIGAGAAFAQDHTDAQICDTPVEVPTWSTPVAVAASYNSEEPLVEIPIGQSVDLVLVNSPEISYAVAPQRPAGSVSYGGMVQFTPAKPGRYRVAISTAAWIDVYEGMTPLSSVNHGRGPDCSGVRKMVDFDTVPGAHLLQIVGNGASSLRVLITALPDQ